MRILVLLAFAAVSGSAQAQLYTCVVDGKKVIRQQPCAAATPSSPSQAPASPSDPFASYRQKGASVKAIMPVFSQLVMFSVPAGFIPAFQNTNGPAYIQEWVPAGETVNKWSQMITVTG